MKSLSVADMLTMLELIKKFHAMVNPDAQERGLISDVAQKLSEKVDELIAAVKVEVGEFIEGFKAESVELTQDLVEELETKINELELYLSERLAEAAKE